MLGIYKNRITSKCTRRGTASFFGLVSRTKWLTSSARAGDLIVMCKEIKIEMVTEIYKQLLLSLQIGGISTMNIHNCCSQLEIIQKPELFSYNNSGFFKKKFETQTKSRTFRYCEPNLR